jgi:hypothetical protein
VSRDISERTYLTRQSVVGHILAGTDPVLPALVLHPEVAVLSPWPVLHRGPSRAVAEFYVRPSESALRGVRNFIELTLDGHRDTRKKGGRAPRPITKKDRRLLELIQRLGGEPPDGPRGKKREFWTKALTEWNAAVPRKEQYADDWRLPRKAYHRLLGRLHKTSSA